MGKEKTVEGLLRRGLASQERHGDEEVVRLHFNPQDHYGYAGLDVAERNACVGCGAGGVARFYVIPKVFFHRLPQKCKSYNCHDIVMACPACRAKAEPPQLARVQQLLEAHGAPPAGSTFANESPLSCEANAAKRAARALLQPPRSKKGALPAQKEQDFRRTVAAFSGVDVADLARHHIERAARTGQDEMPPSERVSAAVSSDQASLRSFLREWRQLFVDTLRPRFLPEGWSVDTGLEDRFVPSVASSMEWPCDWRCAACGVHCFGRSDQCRSCGAARQETSEEPRSSEISHHHVGCG